MDIKNIIKQMLCIHNYTGGARVIFDKKGNKRYARICKICGKKNYVDLKRNYGRFD